MSEDRDKNISREVTSDAKNTESAYIGNARIWNKSGAVSGADSNADDDILELIRKRKSVADTDSDAAISDGADTFSEAGADADTNAGADAVHEADTDAGADAVSGADTVSDALIGSQTDNSADNNYKDTNIQSDDEEILDLIRRRKDGSGRQPFEREEIRSPEVEPISVKSDFDIIAPLSESVDEDITAETSDAASSGNDNAADNDDISELERELSKDFAENSSGRTVRRYGFKPYTRELQAEEINQLRSASQSSEGAAAAGIIRKMTKGSGKKKRKSGASGTARTSKKTSRVDKAAIAAKIPAHKGAASTSKSSRKSSPKSSSSASSKKSGSKKGSRPKKKWIGFVRAFVRTVIILGLVAVLSGAGYAAYVISHADTIHPRNIYDTLDVSTNIYDDQENLVDEIYYSENRQIVSFGQLPDNLTNAFIAVEDKTFWTHKGFNFKRIIGAILERFHGGRISGTSTITQQLARNVFLPEDKSVRSIKRKIIEMYYAYEIEQELSKEEIITAYLNTIYLGYGCYGVDTAAKTYFSTDVEGLTLEQCAALAALPQAPGTYSLLVTEPTDNTVEYKNGIYINDASQDRRNMILNMMLQQGMITQEEKDAAVKPLADFINPGSTDSATSTSAFKDYLIETVKKDLMNEYGIEEDQAVKIIYTKGLNIYTTMDSQAQKTITEQFRKKKYYPSTVSGKGEVESAMVVCEVGTGEIKAMVGTRNASGQMLFNRATNPRQPGSSIKPLSVYAPALQKSLEYQEAGKKFKFKDTGYDKQGTKGWGDYITVSSKVIDEKMKVNGEDWPQNVTRTFSGYNTFRTAIQQSINTCAVKILAQVGIEYSMDTLKRFGITSAIDDSSQGTNDLNYAALGLGAMSYGISPLEMACAYAAFPNGGVRNTPIIYTKVEDSSGRTLLEGRSETVRVLDEGVAWIMTDVLKKVVSRGIGQPAAVDGIEVGGKTGTTNDCYDIWFNGFTPTYAISLWIGTDDNEEMDSLSDKAAALWSRIVSRIDRAYDGKYKSMPDNVFRAWDGDYYTKGTAPPEPEPEPEEEEGEEGKDGKDAAKPADGAEAPAPAPAAAE